MFIDKISRSPYNERKQGESSMQSTKTNYEMKQYNFQTVFKIIQRYSSISRRELQNLSSLSWGSISSITADMVSNGLIIEKSHKLGYSGRTPKLLTINNQKNRILGIDINVSAITFALCDLGGLVLQSERVRPQELHKSYILSLIDEYIAKYFATYDEIIMIAFSVQGQIDRTENISVSIDKIDGWENVPLRSLFAEKYGRPTPEALVESAFGHIALLEKYDFHDICVSMKSSSVPLMIEAYRLFSERSDYPLHIGVTETGTARMGTIKSAMGIGALLCQGIGDTMRVSLTADPVQEVLTAKDILKAAGLRKTGVNIIACPTCGRTRIDLIGLANQIEQALAACEKPITVAVMGCVVNGPGEAREADIGIAGGDGCGILFVRGKQLKKLPYDELLPTLLEYIEKL